MASGGSCVRTAGSLSEVRGGQTGRHGVADCSKNPLRRGRRKYMQIRARWPPPEIHQKELVLATGA